MLDRHLSPYQLIATATLALVCSLSVVARAQTTRPVHIELDFDRYELGLYFDILEDPSGELTIDQVITEPHKSQFSPSMEAEPGRGFTGSSFWLRFTLDNSHPALLDTYLEVTYPLIDHIDLFIPLSDTTFEHRTGGDRVPFVEREIDYRKVLFNIEQAPQSQKTYFVRLQSSSSMNMGLSLWSIPALSSHVVQEMAILGIFHGGIILIIIFNLLLFAGFRDKNYLFFVLFFVMWELTILSLNGLSFQYLWPNSIWWANRAIPFGIFASSISVLIYVRNYLTTPVHIPRTDFIMRVAIVVSTFGSLAALIFPYKFTTSIGAALAVVIVSLVLVAGILSLRSQQRIGTFFLAGWSVFLFGVVLFALKSLGILPTTFITHWGMQIGTFIPAIIFTIGMLDQINTLQNERLAAQKEALESQDNLVASLKESEAILEERVEERTVELGKKNEELETSYAKLHVLTEIGQKITSTLDPEESLNVIYSNIDELMDLYSFALGVYQPDKALIRFRYAVEDGKRLDAFDIKMDDPTSFSPWVVANNSEILMNDPQTEWTQYLSSELEEKVDLRAGSMIFLPLSVESRVVGVIVIKSEHSNAFDPSDLEMMRTLCAYGAISIDNTNAYAAIKNANDTLQKTQDQLVQSEKMASLGQLTAGIAHELKNPLNFVNNFAKLSLRAVEEMKEEFNSHEGETVVDRRESLDELLAEIQENSEKINEHGTRADGIVRSMLLHSRGKPGDRLETDLNVLLDEYIELAYHGMRATDSTFNLKIRKDFDSEIGLINVVPQELGRVFVNMFNNAFYAIREKSQNNKQGYEPELRVSTKKRKSGSEIVVWDNGTGIPDDQKGKIFEPFYSTKPTGSGTGLGLSMSFEIINQMHGGSIAVESREGEFTQFTITLPNA